MTFPHLCIARHCPWQSTFTHACSSCLNIPEQQKERLFVVHIQCDTKNLLTFDLSSLVLCKFVDTELKVISILNQGLHARSSIHNTFSWVGLNDVVLLLFVFCFLHFLVTDFLGSKRFAWCQAVQTSLLWNSRMKCNQELPKKLCRDSE